MISISAKDIPEDVRLSILAMGRVEWGATEAKSDADHLEEFGQTLRITREHFQMTDDRRMQGLYLEGTGTVIAHTGTSPNSANHARILVGLWNWLHEAIAASESNAPHV